MRRSNIGWGAEIDLREAIALHCEKTQLKISDLLADAVILYLETHSSDIDTLSHVRRSKKEYRALWTRKKYRNKIASYIKAYQKEH